MIKQFTGQGLSEIIRKLIMSSNFVDLKLITVGPKPVPLVEKVAGAVGDAMIGRKIVSTLVILKDSGTHGGAD